MDEELSKEKMKTQDILTEIDNLKKYNKELLLNTKGDKLESYITQLEKNIQKLQEESELFYDNKYKKN